jgi:hypothetical protein
MGLLFILGTPILNGNKEKNMHVIKFWLLYSFMICCDDYRTNINYDVNFGMHYSFIHVDLCLCHGSLLDSMFLWHVLTIGFIYEWKN